MYVPKVLPFLFVLAVACQPKPSPQQPSEGLDTVLTDTPATTAAAVRIDSAELQLQAQDTLFEDGSIPSTWENAGFTDPAGFKHFVIRFKEWVKNDKVDSVAAHTRFPLKKYKNAAQFKEHYAEIFDPAFKAIVAQQRLDRIFRNYQGAMLGAGAIWFTETEQHDYRVIAINK